MPSKLYSYKSPEREPLLLKRHHQPAVTNQPKPLSALRIDNSKLPKDNYSSTDFLDLKRIRRTGIYYAKTGSVFLLAIICCTIIAATPEKTPLVHLYTVSSVRAPTINVTPSIEAYSVLLVRIKGALLYSSGRDSANLTVTVDRQLPDDVNSVETRNWTVPIQPTFVNDMSKEIVREMYFPIGQKAHRDRDRLSIRLSTEHPHSLPIVLAYETLADAIHNEVLYAGIVLAFVYGLITLELAHRALAAMLGSLMSVAALSLVNRRPSLAEVIAWLDFETLSLLFGMMVMVGIFSESGFFDWLAVAAYRLARGRKAALTALLCLFAGGASAFLDNVSTILLMTPVTIRLCELLRLDPRQLLIAQLFKAVGLNRTGCEVFIVIQFASGVTFAGFTLHMTLGALPAALAAYVLFQTVYWRDNVKSESSTENGDSAVADELRREAEVWRRTAYGFSVTTREQAAVKAMLQARICELEHRMVATTERPSTSGVSRDDSLRTFEQNLVELQQKYKIRDKELLVKCCLVLMGVVALFFVSSTVPSLHLDLGWIAVMGAIALLVLTDFADLDTLLHRIEWSTLVFFASLFAMMEALRRLGLIGWIGDQVHLVVISLPETARLPVAIIVVLWTSALASAFIDNIPFTTAMVPVVLQLSDILPLMPLVWSLAFGVCFGGNGTLIGASANVVAAGVAEQNGYPISFVHFVRVGFPVLLVTVTVAMLYLLICHAAFGWNYS
uniref:CitMHS domain-containing protein n=1 Tax=Macrostomum lignano TaxID=282301 RepID=A0A1I8H2Z2_9PLAT